MTKRALLLAVLSLWSCRNLTEVVIPPEEKEEPAFLGPFSGVYGGIDSSKEAYARTILVHLNENVLISPLRDEPGQPPELSMFATIVDVSDGSSTNQSFGLDPEYPSVMDLTLASDIYGRGYTGCMPEDHEDYPDANLPDPERRAAFIALMGEECPDPPAECLVPCINLNRWHDSDFVEGPCLDNGAICAYPLTVGGKISRTDFELYFKDESMAPPRDYRAIDCPGDGDWQLCLRYPKRCDFDSSLAGVYDTTLTLDEEASTGTSPPDLRTALDLAVAVAENLGVIILFSAGVDDGDRDLVFFGTFDPFSYEIEANDGEKADDAASRFRDPDQVSQITGRLDEDAVAGEVTLTGTWTLTTGQSTETDADDETYVYDISGSRLSGVSTGTACDSLGECPIRPTRCPFDISAFEDDEDLFFTTSIDDSGCLQTTCARRLGPEQLCADAGGDHTANLGCPPTFFDGDRRYATLAIVVECPDETPDCAFGDPGSCVSLICIDPDEAVNSTEWAVIDSSCGSAESEIILTYEEQGRPTIHCDNSTTPCTTYPPSCPLGYSDRFETHLFPYVDPDGCVQTTCSQQFRNPDDLCADADPTCASGVPVPTVRTTEGEPDCVEYVCEPSCIDACNNGCEDCADPVIPDCGEQMVIAEDHCGCVALRCAEVECTLPPVTCPYGTDFPPNDMQTWIGPDGCIQLQCNQYYGAGNLCGDVSPGDIVNVRTTCGAGEVAVPYGREGVPCIEYACRPSCESTCPDWCSCTDHILLDDFDCLDDGNVISASDDGCGCPQFSCGPPP